MEVILVVVPLCTEFYTHHLLHESPEKNGICCFFVPSYREENSNSEKLGNFSEATQWVRDMGGI